MTTASPSKPSKPAAHRTGPRVLKTGDFPIAAIAVASNVRKKFDEAAIKELVVSISNHGVIQPITLRSDPEQGYILVAGERRLRAAALAGLDEIPGRVLELTSEEALIYQIEENINRKDLTPIEEAFGYKTLTSGGRTVEEIASMTGKSESHIYRTMRLAELPSAVTDLIESGALTPAHGHQLLRLADDQRGEVIDWLLKPDWEGHYETAGELRQHIDCQIGADLKHAVFPKNKEYAGAVACSACPYNSGNQGKLFDGVEDGRCSNRPCFDKKTEAYWETRIDALNKKHAPEAIRTSKYSCWAGQNEGGYIVKGPIEKDHKCKAGEALVIDKSTNTAWLAVKPKAEKGTGTNSQNGQNGTDKRDPKAEFIENAVGLAHLKALADKSYKLTKKHLVKIIDSVLDGGLDRESIEAALGYDLGETNKLTETELVKAITLLVVAPYGHQSASVADLEDLGVKVKAVAKEATKQAEKAWAAQLSAKQLGKEAGEKAAAQIVAKATR